MNQAKLSFACARCGIQLEKEGSCYTCNACGYTLKQEENIYLNPKLYDPFYEDKFVGSHGLTRKEIQQISSYNIDYRRYFSFKKYLKPDSRILDIGCGGGNRFFKDFASELWGIDLSSQALRNAAENYDVLIQSSLGELPVNIPYFDYAVSWDFWGHIDYEEKDALLEKVFQVLKPGGISMHIIETDGNNRLFTIAKQSADKYREIFIDRIGHIGLEKGSKVVDRFKAQGYEIVHAEPMWNIWTPYNTFIDYFSPFASKSMQVRMFLRFYRFLRMIDQKTGKAIASNFLGILNRIESSYTPLDEAEGLFIVAKKPATHQ